MSAQVQSRTGRADATVPADTLLQVNDLRVTLKSAVDDAIIDGVSFSVRRGEALAIVGESGCGKTTTAHAVCRLLDESVFCTTAQELSFRDPHGGAVYDARLLDGRGLSAYRGRQVALVSQDAVQALNPVVSVGRQLVEAVRLHSSIDRADARQLAQRWLQRVGLPDAERSMGLFAHELSGGMAQRVMIAMALISEPALLVADEPTTGLDTSTQSRIIDLLARLQAERELALLLITHDLDVVARVADRICVMYAGAIVEAGPTERILRSPLHPYTRALLMCAPTLNERQVTLPTVAGRAPQAHCMPMGCRFHPRCELSSQLASTDPDAAEMIESEGTPRHVLKSCRGRTEDRSRPTLLEAEPGHFVACWEWRAAATGQ